MSLPLLGLPPFRLFMIFFPTIEFIYIEQCCCCVLSLFGHELGSYLEYANHPSDSLFLLCFDWIVAFLFNPTCTLLSFRRVCC
jgi:hypothetical protein